MNDLQRITEFGELQTALETIAELRSEVGKLKMVNNRISQSCKDGKAELKAKNYHLQSVIDQLIDNVPPTIIATKESPESVLERFNRECDL